MPIYAYKCESCGFAKDVLQKMSDPLLTDCPTCGAATFKKQLTAAGFQLKGSGWYATDFKGAGAPATSVPALNTGSTDAPSKTSDAASPSPAAAATATKTDTSASSGSGGCAGSCACH